MMHVGTVLLITALLSGCITQGGQWGQSAEGGWPSLHQFGEAASRAAQDKHTWIGLTFLVGGLGNARPKGEEDRDRLHHGAQVVVIIPTEPHENNEVALTLTPGCAVVAFSLVLLEIRI